MITQRAQYLISLIVGAAALLSAGVDHYFHVLGDRVPDFGIAFIGAVFLLIAWTNRDRLRN
jgi:hypothetical protein